VQLRFSVLKIVGLPPNNWLMVVGVGSRMVISAAAALVVNEPTTVFRLLARTN
jgi:hypothetical protein